jgi:hypothetical protein
LEERRLELEEKETIMELITDENKMMTMDLSTMDAFTREWWDMGREEIMEWRRLTRLHSHANSGGAPMGGSSGGGSSGDINGGNA